MGSRDLSGLAGRYATALFDLARAARTLEPTAEALARLEAALAQEAELRALVGDVRRSRAELERALLEVADRLELPAPVRAFVGVLARNGRARLLPHAIQAFRWRLAQHHGELTAQVRAAHPLSTSQQAAIATRLEARTGCRVNLAVDVDPALLGGIVVRLGSEQIDASVRSRLQRLGARMKGL